MCERHIIPDHCQWIERVWIILGKRCHPGKIRRARKIDVDPAPFLKEEREGLVRRGRIVELVVSDHAPEISGIFQDTRIQRESSVVQVCHEGTGREETVGIYVESILHSGGGIDVNGPVPDECAVVTIECVTVGRGEECEEGGRRVPCRPANREVVNFTRAIEDRILESDPRVVGLRIEDPVFVVECPSIDTVFGNIKVILQTHPGVVYPQQIPRLRWVRFGDRNPEFDGRERRVHDVQVICVIIVLDEVSPGLVEIERISQHHDSHGAVLHHGVVLTVAEHGPGRIPRIAEDGSDCPASGVSVESAREFLIRDHHRVTSHPSRSQLDPVEIVDENTGTAFSDHDRYVGKRGNVEGLIERLDPEVIFGLR